MLTWTIERAHDRRWLVVGRDTAGQSVDCRFYATRKAAQSALAARQEEQAEGIAAT